MSDVPKTMSQMGGNQVQKYPQLWHSMPNEFSFSFATRHLYKFTHCFLLRSRAVGAWKSVMGFLSNQDNNRGHLRMSRTLPEKGSFYCRLEFRLGPTASITSLRGLKGIKPVSQGGRLLLRMESIKSYSGLIALQELEQAEVLLALIRSMLLIRKEADDRALPPPDR